MADPVPSRLLNLAALVTLLVTVAPSAFGQVSPPPPVDPAEAGGTGIEPIRLGPLTLSGSAFVDGLRIAGEDDGGVADAVRVRRARLGIAGSVIPKIGWNVSGEFSGEPSLRNAFAVVRFADWLHLRAGQATPPSGIERGTSPLVLELIDRSRVTTRLTSALDLSVTAMNDRPIAGWLSYAFSVASGAGFNRRDNNRAKDIVTRIALAPPGIRGLAVVASGSSGEQPHGRRTRSGIGAQYDVRRFKLAAEVLRQKVDWAPDADGYYVTGVYRVRPQRVTPHFRMFELGVRYAVLDDPASAAGAAPDVIDDDGGGGAGTGFMPTRTRELQVGGNYYVNRHVRFLLDTVVTLDARDATTVIGRVQVAF